MRKVIVALAVLFFASSALYATGDIYVGCPVGTHHYSYAGNGQLSQEITAPPGFWFAQTQVKAGATDWGYGSRGHQEPVQWDPAQSPVTVRSADKHGISHVHVCKTRTPPPPECEPGDPCWCEPGGPGYPCKPPPEEVCPTDIRFVFEYVKIGFTRDLNAPVEEACDGDRVFVGKPGDQILWGACVDGYVRGTGAEIYSPKLPYTESGITTVGQVSTVVSGGVAVTYGNNNFDNCTYKALAEWVGAVAADTDTELCLPDDPCWCEALQDEDPRCVPPPETCKAYAALKLNAVLGHDEEACYAGLAEADVKLPILVDHQAATICWSGRGGPERFTVDGVYDRVTYDDIGARGAARVWVEYPLRGAITASAHDPKVCYQQERRRFEFVSLEELCPWIE